MKRWVLGCCLFGITGAQAQVLLEQGKLNGWTAQEFVGVSQYQTVQDPAQGNVLQGLADASASGWGIEEVIDVSQTPLLSWQWKVEQLPTLSEPEQSKAGDDYAARVYVIRKGSFGLLSTQSLVYVHSQQRAVGDIWDSPYTGKVKMMAVSAGAPGDWQYFQRNLAIDWQRAFGKTLDELDAVAFMVDADNSQSQSAALFGTIALKAQ